MLPSDSALYTHTDLSRIVGFRLPVLFTGGWRKNFTRDLIALIIDIQSDV